MNVFFGIFSQKRPVSSQLKTYWKMQSLDSDTNFSAPDLSELYLCRSRKIIIEVTWATKPEANNETETNFSRKKSTKTETSIIEGNENRGITVSCHFEP
ncbi:hypothetical protein AVEN_153165-1 [Araneus ventricosus]|uniref:Uncharacterized protein n=1 Tax=Araneus ventricosus TaxID=182803 RepID=A0A4Y2BK96_ARAVE|nr:hypothetical protein AVEN_153165-1 [Araneus ventricosus]